MGVTWPERSSQQVLTVREGVVPREPRGPREGATEPAPGELRLVGMLQCWPEIQSFNIESDS